MFIDEVVFMRKQDKKRLYMLIRYAILSTPRDLPSIELKLEIKEAYLRFFGKRPIHPTSELE